MTKTSDRQWPYEAQDFFEERAGILQYEAHMTRPAAEREAHRITAVWWIGQCLKTHVTMENNK